jgi:hypothetical protein
MAAARNFPGKSQAWLELRLSEVNEELAAGKMTTAANAGDQGGSFQRETSAKLRQQQLLWDLNILDPDGDWKDSLISSTTRAIFRPTETL